MRQIVRNREAENKPAPGAHKQELMPMVQSKSKNHTLYNNRLSLIVKYYCMTRAERYTLTRERLGAVTSQNGIRFMSLITGNSCHPSAGNVHPVAADQEHHLETWVVGVVVLLIAVCRSAELGWQACQA